jgi:hypothetical protein
VFRRGRLEWQRGLVFERRVERLLLDGRLRLEWRVERLPFDGRLFLERRVERDDRERRRELRRLFGPGSMRRDRYRR